MSKSINTSSNTSIPTAIKYITAAAALSGLSYFTYLLYKSRSFKSINTTINNTINNNPHSNNPSSNTNLPLLTSVLNPNPTYPTILINNPIEFDSVLAEIESKKSPNTRLYLYITAAADPATGKSWCGDCIQSNPIIDSILTSNSNEIILIESPVIRSEYKSTINPIHPYKSHSKIQLQRIPSLYRINNLSQIIGVLIENECKDKELVKEFFSK